MRQPYPTDVSASVRGTLLREATYPFPPIPFPLSLGTSSALPMLVERPLKHCARPSQLTEYQSIVNAIANYSHILPMQSPQTLYELASAKRQSLVLIQIVRSVSTQWLRAPTVVQNCSGQASMPSRIRCPTRLLENPIPLPAPCRRPAGPGTGATRR